MKTLKTFLEKHNACSSGFEFAKDLTLEQFLETCERGDWMLWLFAETNPESLRELTLVKGHCANTVRHLMIDKRSVEAVDVRIAFGEGRATKKELGAAEGAAFAAAAVAAVYASVAATADADAAFAAARATTVYASPAYAAAVYASDASASAAYAAAYASPAYAAAYAGAGADAYNDAKKQNQKQTADICRKFLPIEIWDQSQF